jgi:putative tricarboxylic transport membrane protein
MDSNRPDSGASGGSDGDRTAMTVRGVELVTAVVILAFGAVVIWDSRRLGASWGSDGPQAGYFPFYIGLLIVMASAVNLVRALRDPFIRIFLTVGQAKLVLLILIPLTVYVALIQWLGIYVASTIYIAVFMIWLGKDSVVKALLVSFGVSLSFFLMFEVWFRVPLIKGPLEAALGFG